MRITVRSDSKSVEIHIKGKSKSKLAAAEDTARRLLDATPEPDPARPIGFVVSTDTEITD